MMTKKAKITADTPVWLGFDCTKQQWMCLATLSNRLDKEGIHLTGMLPISKQGKNIGIEMLMENKQRNKGYSLSLIGKSGDLFLEIGKMDCRADSVYKGNIAQLDKIQETILWTR
jgi:hypothetical protein